jgi:hypothetical protein
MRLVYYEKMSVDSQGEQAIISLGGVGGKRTKPFTVPEGIDYFTIRWSMNDEDGLIDLYSLENPTSSIETLSGSGPSETQWYESGRFFFAVNSTANWKIDVVIESDAWSESEEHEVDITEILSDDDSAATRSRHHQSGFTGFANDSGITINQQGLGGQNFNAFNNNAGGTSSATSETGSINNNFATIQANVVIGQPNRRQTNATERSSDNEISENNGIFPATISWWLVEDWYSISATYPEDVFATLKEDPRINWVNDLSRGFIVNESGIARWKVSQGEVQKIQKLVMGIDQSFRLAHPDIQDGGQNGLLLEEPLDENRFIKEMKSVDRSFMRLSNLLRKSGAPSEYLFASGVNRVQKFKVSAATSIDRRNENREASADQWNAYIAPRRAASAFFDEAKRRGY